LTNSTHPYRYKTSNKKGSSLNYRVEDIPPEGALVEGEQGREWLNGLFRGQKTLEFEVASPVVFRFYLSRSEATIFVAGSINLNVEISCSRCLEKFIFILHPESTFTFSPANFQKSSFEKELTREELDIEFYDGEVIDLGRIIQNQIFLSIPINPLCREDCKGLCPHCGINKNQETCECTDDETVDPRLAILKNFFKK